MRKVLIALAVIMAVAALVAIADLSPPAEVSQNYSLYHSDVLHGAPGATSVMVAKTVELNPDTTPTELSAIAAAVNGSSFYSNCMPAFYWYKGDHPATSRVATLQNSFVLNIYERDYNTATVPEVVDLRRQTALLL